MKVPNVITHPTDDLPKVEKGFYEHYKGGLYQVTDHARHSETLEQMVVYRSINHGSLWVRPLSEWQKPIDGQPGVARFKPISSTPTTASEDFVANMNVALGKLTDEDKTKAKELQAKLAEEQKNASTEPSSAASNCGICRREGSLHSYYKTNMGFCHCCKLRWNVGYNLFTPLWPKDESEWKWTAMFAFAVKDYKSVPSEDMK